jgi:hypothetical protein
MVHQKCVFLFQTFEDVKCRNFAARGTVGRRGFLSTTRNEHIIPNIVARIIPSLSRASYSWKKYPTFLTLTTSRFSQLWKFATKDRTRFGQP